VKNIVLFHGGGADGSGWRAVYDNLFRDGFNVIIVQEPETSFQDDVTAVKRIFTLQDGPSILVAHSYGERIRPLPDWCMLQRTCQTLVRTKRTTESASGVTSTGLVR
jgi:pimeloyl-ACP methyl ester carboxylesterase